MAESKLLNVLATACTKRPYLSLIGTVCIYMLLALLALRIEIDVDFTSMIPREDPAVAHVFDTVEHFGSVDRAFLAIENKQLPANPEELDQASRNQQAEQARQCIDGLADVIASWQWQNPTSGESESMVPLMQGHHNQAFKDLQANLLVSRSYLFLSQDYLDNFIKRLNPRYLDIRLKRGPSASVPAELRDRDVLGVWGDYASFWREQQPKNNHVIQKGSYVCTPDERFHILMLSPRHPVKYMEFCMEMNDRLQSLRQTMAEHPEWQHFQLHMVGGYISAARDFAEVRHSLFITMVSSVVGVVLLFGFAYRSLRLILLIGIGLIPAIFASLGIVTLVIGTKVSVIVSAFAAILVGLGVDFIIHLYNSYCLSLEEHPGDRAAAARRAVCRVGPGIVVGCLTSVCTFTVLATSDFRGIFELGIVSGCGLLIVLISLLIVVPSFLTIWGPQNTRTPRGLLGYGRAITKFPLLFSAFMFIMIGASFAFLSSTDKIFILDSDLRNLRPYDAEYEQTLDMADSLGIRFASNKVTVFGDNEERVLQTSIKFIDSLHALENDIDVTLAETFAVADLQKADHVMRIANLPSDASKLLARYVVGTPWGDCHFHELKGDGLLGIEPIRALPADAQDIPAGTQLKIRSVFGPMQMNSAARLSPQQQYQNLERLRTEVNWQAIDETLAQLSDEQRKQYPRFINDLKELQQRVNNNDILLTSELARTPLNRIVSTFYHQEGNEHHFLISLNMLYDRKLIPLEELQQAMGIAPEQDGSPVQRDGITIGTCGIPTISNYIQNSIVGDFTKLTSIAMILVTVVLLIGVRQPLYVFLSLLTLTIGLLFTLTVMRACQVPWNIMNIAVIPLIIGIGIDNSIHFLHCLRHHSFDKDGIRKTIRETGHPILMTALTSIIGFGSLMFNAYRGIQGIGIIASIGIFACMIAALFGLPLLIIGINTLLRKNEEGDR